MLRRLLGDLLAPDRKQDLTTYLWGMEVIDFLTEHPSARFTTGGICRFTDETAATPLFSGLELKGVSGTGSLYRGRGPL